MLSALGLPDSCTSLCATFYCGGMFKTRPMFIDSQKNIDDMKNRITAAINIVDHDMQRLIWEKLSYRLEVVHAAGGCQIEQFQNIK